MLKKMTTTHDPSNLRQAVLLIGSSHTGLAYPYVKKSLNGKAMVSKLPHYAGNTREMLISLPDWPLEGKQIVHVYAGLRDLMPNTAGHPLIGPEEFRENLETIHRTMVSRCCAKIVFSNVPPVAEHFFEGDLPINDRVFFYNRIIEDVVSEAGMQLHNFCEFVLDHNSGTEKYLDGLHFTRKFYREYAADLAAFLMKI